MLLYIPQYTHEDYYRFYENLQPCWSLDEAREECLTDLHTRYARTDSGKEITWGSYTDTGHQLDVERAGYVDGEYRYYIEVWDMPDES